MLEQCATEGCRKETSRASPFNEGRAGVDAKVFRPGRTLRLAFREMSVLALDRSSASDGAVLAAD
jgi:hypothetical protein